MPTIETAVESAVTETFRVKQVAGLFDLDVQAKSSRSWRVELPEHDGEWSIGAIVGPSGSGKSRVARAAYGDALVERFDWPHDRAVVDAFPEAMSAKDITAVLSSVGFSSPPAWVLPYHVLSNGQKFRCDMARALLCPPPGGPTPGMVAMDEFTSVVDRQVAQFGSAAIAKTVRGKRLAKAGGASRFVAVTCHHDILEWLRPDWVLDMASGRLARGSLQGFGQRPSVDLEFRLASPAAWPVFRPHHYLSGELHKAARCYAAWWRGRMIAFMATLHQVSSGGHGFRAAHRLVVLPDFQGLGVGTALLDWCARYEMTRKVGGCRVWGIITSHPGLIGTLKNRPGWRCESINKATRANQGLMAMGGRKADSWASRPMIRYRAKFVYLPA